MTSLMISGILSLLILSNLSQAQGEKPNIILFFIDDMGWTDVGFMGSDYYETPNIDQMAADGMIFTYGYANAGNCAPSRAALMSGQYAPRTGVYTVNNSDRGNTKDRYLIPPDNITDLHTDKITIAEVLGPAGYTSASMGKWHLGNTAGTLPTGQGFDVNVGGNAAGTPPGGHFSPYNNPNLSDGPNGEYLTDRLTDEAIAFIEDNKDNPFFLYLTHYAVHTPIQAKQVYIDKYNDKQGSNGQSHATYAAMIQSVDDCVGSIRAALEDQGLTDNTLLVFFADNGGHGVYTNMIGLKKSKGSLYEGGIREPLVFTWPGTIEAGSTSDVPVIGTDFFPTFMNLAGGVAPANYPLDGVDVSSILKGTGTIDDRALFWHYPVYLQRYGSTIGPWRTTPVSVIQRGYYKLHQYFEFGQLELYNLQQDMGEENNLVLDMPGKAHELYTELTAWQDSTNAAIPTELNPGYDPTNEPDFVPTGYTTYEDIEPLLVFGCTDERYAEYDDQANAMDESMCITLGVEAREKPVVEIINEGINNSIRVEYKGRYSMDVYDVSGEKVWSVVTRGMKEFRPYVFKKAGVYFVAVKGKNFVSKLKIITLTGVLNNE